MPIEAPIVGQWYHHRDKGYEFQVTAVDEDAGTVEMQHFDGDLEEVDLETWQAMEVEPVEQPENWTGPLDDVEPDDLGYTETDMSDDDWSEPLRERDDRLYRDDGSDQDSW